MRNYELLREIYSISKYPLITSPIKVQRIIDLIEKERGDIIWKTKDTTNMEN